MSCSSSSFDEPTIVYKDNFVNINPNPDNYTIEDDYETISGCVLLIKYHDCTNYEGNKVLLFRNTTIDEIKEQTLIDPHFSENTEFISPFARFEPTDKGWGYACLMLEMMDKE